MDATNFIGLNKSSAQKLADSKNLIFRMIRVDERNMFGYPEDTRDDRVCIEMDQGQVSKATIQ